MVNKISKYKKITFFISVSIVMIIIIIFQQSQNNSIENKEFSEKVDKIISQKQEIVQKTKISEKSKNTDSSKIVESEVVELQPREYSVVAEEILYPDEYDFGDVLEDTVLKAVGKPIKLNTLPITKAQIGDTIELEFAGKTFSAEVFEMNEQYFMAEAGDDAEGEITLYSFNAYLDSSIQSIKNNQIQGSIGYDKNGAVIGEIHIQHKRGDYKVYINKNVAYYVLRNDWQQEFSRQGYTRD